MCRLTRVLQWASTSHTRAYAIGCETVEPARHRPRPHQVHRFAVAPACHDPAVRFSKSVPNSPTMVGLAL